MHPNPTHLSIPSSALATPSPKKLKKRIKKENHLVEAVVCCVIVCPQYTHVHTSSLANVHCNES